MWFATCLQERRFLRRQKEYEMSMKTFIVMAAVTVACGCTPSPSPTPKPTPTPTPSPTARIACMDTTKLELIDPEKQSGVTEWDQVLNDAMARVSGCDPGSSCKIPYSQDEWYGKVASELEDSTELCVGIEPGNDVLFAGMVPNVLVQEFDLYQEQGAGLPSKVRWVNCWTDNGTRKCGGGYRGDYRLP